MDKNSNAYVVTFAVAICVACSAGLALTFNMLKPQIDANRAFDIQKNILKVVGLFDTARDVAKTRADLEKMYVDRVKEYVVDSETGEVVPDKKPGECKDILTKRGYREEGRTLLALYEVAMPNGSTNYCLPLSQYGLWSDLYGFLAVTGDGTEVVGISYYQQGETPGLGGEVDNPAWQAQWRGKKLYDAAGEFVSITVKKGKVDSNNPVEAAHFVDGLSGATITSNGVTRDLRIDIAVYEKFFSRKRNQ